MTRSRILIFSVLFIVASASRARTEEPPATPVASPCELWLINTRCAPSCGPEAVQGATLDYQRLDEQKGWTSSDEAVFLKAASDGVPTSFFVHGNQINSCEAVSQGWQVHRLMCCMAGDRPFRLVIWSWPSTRVHCRLRADAQIKAARSDSQAYYLARCVDQMPAEARLTLMGHSFGARVITGALHMLSGGDVAGYQLEERENRPRRAARVVLAAAAVDNAWLLPGRRNGLALGQVESMLITQNDCDRVLRWYPRLYGRGGPEALGFSGPCCPSMLGEDREKLEVLGVSCSVGRGHGWADYMQSCGVRGRLPWYTFLESDAPNSEAEKPTPAPRDAEPLETAA